MEEKVKQNIRLAIITVLLVIATLTATIGVAYSRYQSSDNRDIDITVKKPVEFYISGLNQAEDGSLTQSAAPVFEEQPDGTYKMMFRIDNGTTTDDENYIFSVVTTLGLSPDCQMSLITQTPNGIERVYEAVATEIDADSELYAQVGPGYEYRFYDNDGNEMVWSLDGGKYSYNDYTLQINGAYEESLVEIIVEEPDNR